MSVRKGVGEYPAGWGLLAHKVKAAAGWRCIRCHHHHDPEHGYTLTVHHLDMDKSNNEWWNLAALCQRCHLTVQARVNLHRPWVMTDHSDWFKPYAGGFFAHKYLALNLTREEVEADLEWWATLEQRHMAVMT